MHGAKGAAEKRNLIPVRTFFALVGADIFAYRNSAPTNACDTWHAWLVKAIETTNVVSPTRKACSLRLHECWKVDRCAHLADVHKAP